MWITADDVHAHLLAAEAEEEETLGYAVDDDVECVGGRYRATEQAVGHTTRERQPRIVPREANEAVGTM